MWIITQTGFLSAVQAKGDPTTLVVRARVESDLDRLREVHQAIHRVPADVVVYDVSDYPVRILTSRQVLTRFLADQVEALDYGNFKNRVAQRQGLEREGIYHEVWADLCELERLQ